MHTMAKNRPSAAVQAKLVKKKLYGCQIFINSFTFQEIATNREKDDLCQQTEGIAVLPVK